MGLADQPLTRSQHDLRGRSIVDMTDAQLRDWIEACQKMEAWPRIEAKARREWKKSRVAAESEVSRRADAKRGARSEAR